MSPREFVTETVRQRRPGVSISFDEPTRALEWSLQVPELARSQGARTSPSATHHTTNSMGSQFLIETRLWALDVGLEDDLEEVVCSVFKDRRP